MKNPRLTYMILTEEGKPIANYLILPDALKLLELLLTHNDVVAWTIVPDTMNDSDEEAAPA